MNPLIAAAKKQKETLEPNEAVCVRSTGALRARNVIFANDSGLRNKEEISTYYESIFKTFEDNVKITEKRPKTLAFSVTEEGIDCSMSTLKLCIDKVKEHLLTHENTDIVFLFRDVESMQKYDQLFNVFTEENLEDRISLVVGKVTDEDLDAIICPINNRNYDVATALQRSKTIVQLAAQSMSKESVPAERELKMFSEKPKNLEKINKFLTDLKEMRIDPSAKNDKSYIRLNVDHMPDYEDFVKVFSDSEERYFAIKQIERGYQKQELTQRESSKVKKHFEEVTNKMLKNLNNNNKNRILINAKDMDEKLFLNILNDLIPNYIALKELEPNEEIQDVYIRICISMGGEIQKHGVKLRKEQKQLKELI